MTDGWAMPAKVAWELHYSVSPLSLHNSALSSIQELQRPRSLCQIVLWSAFEVQTTGSPAMTSKMFNEYVKSWNLITDLFVNKSPKQFKVNFPNLSCSFTLPEGSLMNVLAEWTERWGTHTASAWITCHGHQKPVRPMHRFLWSTFLIQRWFSNKISLDFCKHKSDPRGRRSGNSILGNAVWGKMNPEAVLFPETRSCFLVSLRHIDIQWEICFLNSVYWDVTKGFNYLHIHENNMRWKEVCFVLLLHRVTAWSLVAQRPAPLKREPGLLVNADTDQRLLGAVMVKYGGRRNQRSGASRTPQRWGRGRVCMFRHRLLCVLSC